GGTERIGSARGSLPAPHPASPASPASRPLLRRDHEVAPPVLLPAGLVLVSAERRFLALADNGDAVDLHTKAAEVLLHRAGAARAETQVVLGAAARVAVALHGDLRAGPLLHPVGVLLQGGLAFVADVRPVELEEDVLERALGVQLLERLAREDLF